MQKLLLRVVKIMPKFIQPLVCSAMIQAEASQGLGVHLFSLLCYIVPVEGSWAPPEVSLIPHSRHRPSLGHAPELVRGCPEYG